MVIQALEQAGLAGSDDAEKEVVSEETDGLAHDAGVQGIEDVDVTAQHAEAGEEPRTVDIKDLDLANLIAEI